MRAVEGLIPASCDGFSDPSHIKLKTAKGSGKWQGRVQAARFGPAAGGGDWEMAGTNKQPESYEGTAPAKYTGRKLKRTVHFASATRVD
jgi:hypothetical protein